MKTTKRRTRARALHPELRLPTLGKIDARKSTITGMFFAALTPVVEPSRDEVQEALAILGMGEGTVVCAYCGDPKTDWDHFRPITIGRRPTGYITEIGNLVPSCGKCNQSKGNKDWRAWILSDMPRSPKKRNVPDLHERIERLEKFERWRTPTVVRYEEVLGRSAWDLHISNLDRIVAMLVEAEEHASACRGAIAKAIAQNLAATSARDD